MWEKIDEYDVIHRLQVSYYRSMASLPERGATVVQAAQNVSKSISTSTGGEFGVEIARR
jgi:hypothetical protein